MTLWLAAVSLVSNVLALALPLALLQVYDRIIPTQQYGTATVLFSAVMIAILLDGFLRFARNYVTGRHALLAEYGAVGELSRRLLATDISGLRALGPGAVRSAVLAVTQSRELEGPASRLPLYDAPFVLAFLALVWLLGGWLVLLPAATLLVASIAAAIISRRQRETATRRSLAEQSMFSSLADLLAGFVDLKGFGYAARLTRAASTAANRYAAESEHAEREASFLTDLSQLASLATTVVIALVGSMLVVGGGLTTGGLAACTMLGSRAVGSGLGIFAALARRGAAQAARSEVAALRDRIEAAHVDPSTIDGPVDLVLDRVAFGRPGLEIAPLSADIPAGSLVQVRAAKRATEVLMLYGICGFERPDSGAVAVRLARGETVSLTQARCQPEKASLFAGTVLDNMTGWDPTRGAAAAGIARSLGLTQLLDRLPLGVMTPVSGTLLAELSEGMIKRIGLVRALAGADPVVCLDRPEVDLDVDGRARLAAWLRDRRGTRTILLTTGDHSLAALCSHRLDLGGFAGPVALPEAAE